MRKSLAKNLCSVGSTFAALLLAPAAGLAAEIGHYAPGMMNIRDFIVPEPGFYTAFYNYYYSSDRLNAPDGDEINSVTIGPGAGVTLGVDVDVDIYAFAPALIWVPDWKPLGVRFGVMVVPSFSNTSVGAALATQTGRAADADTSQFNVGDLFVQPIWMAYSLPHWDFSLGFGFYAPTGKYDVESFTIPTTATTIRVEAADNIGFGFWTQQAQAAVSWFPFDNKGTAVATALTYEHHYDKEDFDLTPGRNLALNWGISQYLPLTSDQTALLELGPWGYSSWQVTRDEGSDASPGGVRDQVHAVGGQLGLTYVPWTVALNAHYAYEFHSENRFQGHAAGISLAIGFGTDSEAH